MFFELKDINNLVTDIKARIERKPNGMYNMGYNWALNEFTLKIGELLSIKDREKEAEYSQILIAEQKRRIL